VREIRASTPSANVLIMETELHVEFDSMTHVALAAHAVSEEQRFDHFILKERAKPLSPSQFDVLADLQATMQMRDIAETIGRLVKR